MLFELHDRLMNVSESINQCYSTNTVVYVTVSFILAMFGIFFETKEIFYNFKNELNLAMMATSYILWGIQNNSIIIVLLHLCEGTREHAYDSSMIVHKIVQKKPLFLLQSNIFYNKMKSFSLQTLHRKKTFSFSGQGLFIFDHTFLFSVRLKTVTTQIQELFKVQNSRISCSFFSFSLFIARRSVQEHHIWLYCFSLICHSDAIRMHKKWTLQSDKRLQRFYTMWWFFRKQRHF